MSSSLNGQAVNTHAHCQAGVEQVVRRLQYPQNHNRGAAEGLHVMLARQAGLYVGKVEGLDVKDWRNFEALRKTRRRVAGSRTWHTRRVTEEGLGDVAR